MGKCTANSLRAMLTGCTGLYEPFDVVTKQSLQHAIAEHNAQFLDNHVDEIMKSYNELQPYAPALLHYPWC